MTSGPTQFIAPVESGEIRGWSAGTGPAVLVLHGGPGLSDYTSPLADELVDDFTVHRYQQRGLAPSTTSGPFTVATHISDAIAVMDAIGAPKALLVGHSWGGHLAMHIAVTHPDRLLGLVVVDPLGVVGDGGEADMGRSFGERMSPAATARATELDEKAMRGEGEPGDALEALSLVWPAYFSKPDKAPPMPEISMSLPCYSETWESIHQELARGELPGLLSTFNAPTAFVMGADSPQPPRHGLASAALIPGATTEVVAGCGHFPWLERPGVVRDALKGVVART